MRVQPAPLFLLGLLTVCPIAQADDAVAAAVAEFLARGWPGYEVERLSVGGPTEAMMGGSVYVVVASLRSPEGVRWRCLMEVHAVRL